MIKGAINPTIYKLQKNFQSGIFNIFILPLLFKYNH